MVQEIKALEAFHAVIWRMLVAHSALQQSVTKWESTVTYEE